MPSDSSAKRLGICVGSRLPAAERVKFARLAEEQGLTHFWTTESPSFRTGLPVVMAAAQVTDRIQLGVGTIGIYTRHPALIAAEA